VSGPDVVPAMVWAATVSAVLAVLVRPSRRRRPAGLRGRPAPPGSTGSAPGRSSPEERVGAPAQLPVAVLLDLVAAALAAGLPTANAVQEAFIATGGPAPPPVLAAVRSMTRGTAVDQAWAGTPSDYRPLVRALRLAERSGAAVGPLIRATAADERAARARVAQVAARRLGVRLVLPLGLTTLPAFLLLGVLPIVVGFAEPVLRG
jgi:Type II secretion system (T2SS), protein F